MNSVNTTITSEVTQPDEVAVPVQESKPAETIIEDEEGNSPELKSGTVLAQNRFFPNSACTAGFCQIVLRGWVE